VASFSRALVVAVSAAGLIVSAALAAGPAMAATSPSPVATSSASAAPRVVVPAAPAISKVSGGAVSGQLVVSYTAPVSDGGSAVTGYEVTVDAGVTWWPCVGTDGTCTLTNLTNGRAYTVSLRAVNAAGPSAASVPATGTPSVPAGTDPDKPKKLPKPRVWVNASFNAAGNKLGVDGSEYRLGVGTLPQLTFSRAIPDKRVAESHLTVKALLEDGRTRTVKGAWGWVSDRTVVFRPAKYWPGRATITITSTMDRAVMGKQGKDYVVGSGNLATTYTFRTARKLIARVDGSTSQMKVYIDGHKVKTFGVSLGKDEWETRNGVKVISTDKEPTHTYTSTSLNLDPAVEAPYELVAPWNTRLTPTGEFIHTAKWAYSRIGRYNGSHGCTNMFEQDAKWIFDKTVPGDVVEYVNTGGETVQSWNGPGGLWNIPWDQWLKKSALGSVNGSIDTSNATVGSGGRPVGA
jgi:lipoprotein-anchoring transpeptidase ErfK/SrfK